MTAPVTALMAALMAASAKARAAAPVAALLLAVAAGPAQAGVLRACDPPPELNAAQQDRLLRLAAMVKAELEAAGRPLALIARSGLDLRRFGQRYSHAGFSLREGRHTPWSVRQLYYACDEQRPRLFDQGLAGFLLGTDDPQQGYVSLLLLPPQASAALARAALDDRRALAVLGPRYSANAYAFDTRYQNCNQWVAELWALAIGGLDAEAGGADGDAGGDAAGDGATDDAVDRAVPPDAFGASTAPRARARAQHWLKARGYDPVPVTVRNPLLMLAAHAIPWLHLDDHPAADLARQQFRTSLPATLEQFVRATVPGAERIELCHAGARAVIRRGWRPIADGCEPEAGDTVLSLQ